MRLGICVGCGAAVGKLQYKGTSYTQRADVCPKSCSRRDGVHRFGSLSRRIRVQKQQTVHKYVVHTTLGIVLGGCPVGTRWRSAPWVVKHSSLHNSTRIIPNGACALWQIIMLTTRRRREFLTLAQRHSTLSGVARSTTKQNLTAHAFDLRMGRHDRHLHIYSLNWRGCPLRVLKAWLSPQQECGWRECMLQDALRRHIGQLS